MKYTVIWQPKAQSALAAIWNIAEDRAAVTASADEIDRQLSLDPQNVGESRSGTTHITIIEPLTAYFRVDE